METKYIYYIEFSGIFRGGNGKRAHTITRDSWVIISTNANLLSSNNQDILNEVLRSKRLPTIFAIDAIQKIKLLGKTNT